MLYSGYGGNRMVREKLTFARKSFGFRLNVALIKQIKILAVNEGKAVNVLIEEGVEDLLKKYSKKGK
jgi:hypothetical protein